MPTPDNKAVVQEFYDQWNAGAIDFDRLVHEDIANHQPDKEPERERDAFRQAIAGVMRAVPGSKWTTLNLIEEGDLVVCHNTWSGTYGGTVNSVGSSHDAHLPAALDPCPRGRGRHR